MHRLRRALITLFSCIAVLIAGCATQCPAPPRLAVQGRPIIDVHVYVELGFSERERVNIINGIMMWERATNGLVTWQLLAYDPMKKLPSPGGSHDGVEERTVLFRRATSNDEWVKEWEAGHKPKTLLGLCQGNSLKEVAWLWLVENRLTTPDEETIIVAHEFGHAIGLDHIVDKASTMSEFYNTSVKCLTEKDLVEFCKKHGCDLNLVHVPVCKPD